MSSGTRTDCILEGLSGKGDDNRKLNPGQLEWGVGGVASQTLLPALQAYVEE